MTDTPFDRFINFVECMQKHTSLSKGYSSLQHKRDIIEAEIAERQKAIDDQHDATEKLKREVHLVELEGKSLREREKEIRQKLPNVTNQKEYVALTKEVDEIERRQEANENRLLSLFEMAEKQSTDEVESVSAHDKWLEEQRAKSAELAQQCEQLQQELGEKRETCDALAKLVDDEQLAEYKRMAPSLEDPVVPLDGEYCSACRFEVAHKDRTQLKRQVLTQCKNCYRLLYQRTP